MKIHIVQKGDTLWNIAKKYGVNFEELKKMNAQLSNPEMIMPGMKIKVPTTGGTIKKEMVSPVKEMPKAEQPYKEQPKAVHPYKEKPTPTLPVQKEIIKEVPIEKKETIYTPIMPQPVIPEIDINNYYTMNMSQMQAQVQAPQPFVPPPVHEEKVESPIEMPMPVQEECVEMYPTVPFMPVADCGCGPTPYPYHQPYGFQAPMGQYPMAQGPGIPMGQFPMAQGGPVAPMGQMPYEQCVPYQQVMPQSMGAHPTAVPEAGNWMYEDESSSSSIPMMANPGMHQGGYYQDPQSGYSGMNPMEYQHFNQGVYPPANEGQYPNMPPMQTMPYNPYEQQQMGMYGMRPNNPQYYSHQHYGHHYDDHHYDHDHDHDHDHHYDHDHHGTDHGHMYSHPYGQHGHYGQYGHYGHYGQYGQQPYGQQPYAQYSWYPNEMNYGHMYPGTPYSQGYPGGYPFPRQEDSDDFE